MCCMRTQLWCARYVKNPLKAQNSSKISQKPKFCFQTQFWSQSSSFESFCTSLLRMVSIGQRQYPKMKNFQISPY